MGAVVPARAPVSWTAWEAVAATEPIRHLKVYVPLPIVAVSWADVPGPIVSISPTIAPPALSSLTSPASPELLVTVNVCVPVVPAVHSGAQSVFVTVTVVPARVALAGSAAIAAPAARAGTATRTPATAHGRRPARCSHLLPELA